MSRFFDLLATRTDAEAFEPGELIYLEGEPGALVFVLLAGEVVLERDGRALAVVSAGEVFGEGALTGEPRRSTTARARSAATVAPVGPALYRDLATRAPEIADAAAAARARHACLIDIGRTANDRSSS